MVIEFWLGISEPTVMFLWFPSRVNLTLEFAGLFLTGKMCKQITVHVFQKTEIFRALFLVGKLDKLAGDFNFKVLLKVRQYRNRFLNS